MNTKNSFATLDPYWDELEVTPSGLSSMPIIRVKTTAHCDCEEVNFKTFGRLPRSAKYDRKGLQFIQVEATKDGFCPHCGHHVVQMVPSKQPPRQARQFQGANSVGVVYGVNVKTGERREYPSATAALRDGCWHLYPSLNSGKAHGGWLWTRHK